MEGSMQDLPEDLLCTIVDRLELPDLYRLGYTCKSFYSMCCERCPLQYRNGKHLPWLIVPLKNAASNGMAFENKDEVGFFSLCNGITYKFEIQQLSHRRICGSLPGGWLMTVHENSEIQLFNPFHTVQPVIQLPPLTMFPRADATKESSIWMRDILILKFAMASPSLSYGTVIMAIQGRPTSLAYYKIGGSQQKAWTKVLPKFNHIQDITYYQGNFYAVSTNGYVVVIKDLETETPYLGLVIPQHTFYLGDVKYILVSGGDLLVVHRSITLEKDRNPDNPPHRTVGFKVLKLKFGCVPVNQWEELNNIGDRALFLGYNSSFSLSSADFPGCRPNSIYFTDDIGPYNLINGYGGHDLGIFSLEDCTIERLISPTDCRRVMPPPIWYTPNLP